MSLDHATGDPRARITRRIGLIVVPVRVKNETCTTFPQDRIVVTLLKGYPCVVLPDVKASVVRHLEIPKIAGMRSFRIFKSVLRPAGVEMLTGGLENWAPAASPFVNVQSVSARLKVVYLYLNEDAVSFADERGFSHFFVAGGEGLIEPAVEDGLILGSVLPKPKASVSVLFCCAYYYYYGPWEGFISYAGGVPEASAGLLQGNLRMRSLENFTDPRGFQLCIGSQCSDFNQVFISR